MGMVVCFHALEEEKAHQLLKDSSNMEEWLWSEKVQASGDILDLDKSWHALHYLFTGSSWESDTVLGQAIMGGKPFGDDMGMGPTRMLMPTEVKNIAEALDQLTPDLLRKNFNPETMKSLEIYPAIWDRAEEMDEEFSSYLMPNFEALKKHYTEAAKAGKAMMLYIT